MMMRFKRLENSRTKSRTQAAFTLIELVVAIALGTLLLTTLMGVLRRSFAEIRVAASDDPSKLGRVLLAEQLRRDLTNARRMTVGNNRFELEGFIHRDPVTLIATHRPAHVIYEVRQSEGQSLLVRIQSAGRRGIRIRSNQFVESVYAGVANMLVSSNQASVMATEAETIGLGPDAKSKLSERRATVPSSVKVLLIDLRGGTILDQTFVRQREG